jgi:hypothetical protein
MYAAGLIPRFRAAATTWRFSVAVSRIDVGLLVIAMHYICITIDKQSRTPRAAKENWEFEVPSAKRTLAVPLNKDRDIDILNKPYANQGLSPA